MKKLFTFLFLVLICKFSLAQFPTYTVTFLNNQYMITCGNPTVTVVVGSSTAPGYTVSYTIPGNYTIVAVSGTMTTHLPISILSDTLAPTINIASTSTVFTCAQSAIQLLGSSPTQSPSYLWTGGQGTIATTGSINVSSNYTIAPSVSPFGTYSLTVKDLVSQCISTSVVTIYQNIYPPNAIISSNPVSAFTCLNYSILLSNSSVSGIPANSVFTNTQSLVATSWGGPFIGTPSSNPNIYTSYVAGTYTMTVKDLNNGCVSSTVITLGDNRIYPSIPAGMVSTITCPGGTVNLNASATGNNLSYVWSDATGTISGANSSSLMVNTAGYYIVTVTNSLNGCASQAEISVYACVGFENFDNPLTVLKIFPNPVIEKLYFISDHELLANSKLEVINTLGQIVVSKDKFNMKEGLDLNYLKAGIYYVEMETGKYSKTFKIVKE